VDYLLKPVNPSDLEKSFTKLENFQHSFTSFNNLYKDIQKLMGRCSAFYPSTILCHFREQIIPLPTDSIKYISTEDRLVYIYTGEKPYTINNTLDQLTSTLNPYQFFRANRNYIIHRNAIQSIKKTLGRKLNVKLTLPDSPIISVGKDKTNKFKKWLENTLVE
jgi:DNA-binding LytR/AlgR family response regulator